MSGKRNQEFYPSLDKIPEESSSFIVDDSIDTTLDEYAILTDEDLRKALYLTDSSDSEENDEQKHDFSSLHSSACIKNQTIIQKLSLSEQKDNLHENFEVSSKEDDDHPSADDVFCDQEFIVNEKPLYGTTIQENNVMKSESAGNNENNDISDNDIKQIPDLGEVFSSNLIDFNSANGKQLFSQSVQKKYMNIFYSLSQHMRSNLTNNSFHCCLQTSAEIIKKKLISLKKGNVYDRHIFIEFLHSLHIENIPFESHVVWKTSSLSAFRKAVKISSVSSNIILACCYWDTSANVNSFSIIGGYHKERDMVLLFDMVSTRIPSKWVKATEIWKHMISHYHRYQGYVLINHGQAGELVLTDDLSLKFSYDHHGFFNWQNDFLKWLELPPALENTDHMLNECFLQIKDVIKQFPSAADTRTDVSLSNELLNVFKGSKIYSAAIVFVASLNSEEKKLMANYFNHIASLVISSQDRTAKKKSFRKSLKKKPLTSVGGNSLALFISSIVLFWNYDDEIEVENEKSTNSSLLKSFQWNERKFMNDNIDFGQFAMTTILKLIGNNQVISQQLQDKHGVDI